MKDGQSCFLVTEDSACGVGLDNFHSCEPLDTDHENLVKFSNQFDNDYVKVKERMKRLVKDAPRVVRDRFASFESM